MTEPAIVPRETVRRYHDRETHEILKRAYAILLQVEIERLGGDINPIYDELAELLPVMIKAINDPF